MRSKVRSPIRLAQPDPDARQLRCAEQSWCLALAASLDWPGFGCGECSAYKAQSPAEYRKDMEGMASLYQALNELGEWKAGEEAPGGGAGRFRIGVGWRRKR